MESHHGKKPANIGSGTIKIKDFRKIKSRRLSILSPNKFAAMSAYPCTFNQHTLLVNNSYHNEREYNKRSCNYRNITDPYIKKKFQVST